MFTKTLLGLCSIGMLFAVTAALLPSFADDAAHKGQAKRGEDKHVFKTSLPVWESECAACHLAYPPQLLPAEGWRKLMGSLEQHFGTDASLDAATVAEILPFLEQNAGSASRYAPAAGKSDIRITETRWFIKEHDEVPATTWKRIDSPANCAACHTTAAQGNYDEDFIQLPR